MLASGLSAPSWAFMLLDLGYHVLELTVKVWGLSFRLKVRTLFHGIGFKAFKKKMFLNASEHFLQSFQLITLVPGTVNLICCSAVSHVASISEQKWLTVQNALCWHLWIASNFWEIRLSSPSPCGESTYLIDGRKEGNDSWTNTADGSNFRISRKRASFT